MEPAIFRRTAREDGVWGILAAAGTAAVLLAALALALDFAAVASAHSDVQAALDAALRGAAHQVAPSSITSGVPLLDAAAAEAAAEPILRASLPGGLGFAWEGAPSVQSGHPAAIAATVMVTAPMPALIGEVTFPVHAEEAIGWLPH